jgi:hypothetical protein
LNVDLWLAVCADSVDATVCVDARLCGQQIVQQLFNDLAKRSYL